MESGISLKPKISVIGCGNVGVRFAYALMIKGLCRQLVMVDRDQRRAEGEVMDLSHGAPYISPVEVSAGSFADIAGSDIVVITAGAKQQVNQTRLDLAQNNVAIFKDLIPEIVKYAGSALLLVVTNPVDVLSYAAYRFSGKPAHEVIGSGTVLDTARFRFLLSQHCHIDAHNVHAYILGEHGDSEFAVWSKAMIGGVLFKDYCLMCGSKFCNREGEFDKIFAEVRDSAYHIIERKGETSYGIGLAIVRIVQAILHDENAILPVSSYVDNYLEVSDVYMSLPAVVNNTGVRELLRIELRDKEAEAFRKSAAAIKKVIKESGV